MEKLIQRWTTSAEVHLKLNDEMESEKNAMKIIFTKFHKWKKHFATL